MPTAREKRERDRTGFLRFVATQLAIAGWLAMTLPSTAQIIRTSSNFRLSNQKDFRRCAARLLNAGISPEATASACAETLRPQNLSTCVFDIKRRTTIAAEDALSTCRLVRRPSELSKCVVNISRNSQEESVPNVLNYCGRSLLPELFADCVVGLRSEVDLAPTQAMDTCIGANDRLPPRDFSPNFIPQNGTPPIQPTLTPQTGTPTNEITPPRNTPPGNPTRR